MVFGQNKLHKTLILSSPNPYKTAGVVALDLYKTLKSFNGSDVKVIVREWDKYPDKNIIRIETVVNHYFNSLLRRFKLVFRKFRKQVLKHSQKSNHDYYIFDYDETITFFRTDKILNRIKFKPDVIIVLFMQNFLSYKNLYELNKATSAPILLYMMDMAPISGGCHYAWDCLGYTKECGNCPGLYSKDKNDQTHINWKFNQENVDKTNIIPIAGSEWQFRQLKESSLFKEKKKHKIFLSIDPNIYKPSDKFETRKLLKIPTNKKIIFIGAVSVDNRRKGFNEFNEALCILQNNITENEINNIHIVIAGNSSPEFKKALNIEHTILGYLNQTQLVTAYQAADVFVNPSIEDSGPMMINQAIMCGTPVVAFEMGVALDLVITGKTGYRAKLKDSNDLANGIKYILDLTDAEYKTISQNCRRLGLELLHPQKQAERFIEMIK